MAGLSRSEYLASLQRQKTNKLVVIWKVTAMTAILIFFPALVLFALGFVIIGGWLLSAVKSSVGLPEN